MKKAKKVQFVPVEFSKEVRAALQCTANHIWPDAGPMCSDNEELAEMVLDANRVHFAGYKAEAVEINQLVKEHGYERVLKTAAALLNYI